MENKVEHTIGDIVGSTIDFRKKTIKFDKPSGNDLSDFFGGFALKKITNSWIGWVKIICYKLAIPFLGILVFAYLIGPVIKIRLFDMIIDNLMQIFYILAIAPIPLIILQYVGPWKAKLERMLVESTGSKNRNKATFTQFKSREFVLTRFNNFYLEFNATKDVSKQLKKIRIKRGKDIYWAKDCQLKDFIPKDERSEDIWLAYFYFDKIPQNGSLRLEWI